MEVNIAFDLTKRELFEMPYPNGVEHKSDHYGSRLMRYTDKGEFIEGSSYIRFADSTVSGGFPSIMYTESLLSLPGDHMQAYEDDSD
ncbi:hypothetical protein KIW84_041194 [Lathyrus oleraceus]|uniref:Uncharacterized protein n=1 Tax=Pisum sativum TaxID=3888 RepID=A0A9D4XCB8_PEA|nr:hypothetical protein KIW84_041194 [Pisum sativum]